MKKKICFIANYEKTYFFSKIALEILKKDKAEIYWIVVNKNLYNYLVKLFDKNKILLINKSINPENLDSNILKFLKLNECLFADRALSIKSKKDASFLNNSSLLIYNFLKRNCVQYIYGEITWSHELIAYNISKIFKKLNIKYFYPSTLRYPLNKFIFFSNYYQSDFFIRKKKNKKKINFSFKPYLNMVDKIKPSNFFFSKSFIFLKIKKFFFENYFDKDDPSKIKKIIRIKNLCFKYFNFFIYNFFLHKVSLNNLEKKKYIVFFLQKKPEASIDIKGMYFDDQFSNFKIVWRLLPSDYCLIIKEHPSCIGDNSYFFYKKFLKYNRTYIASTKDSFKNLIKNSCATFSVASTASIESAILKIPSFTMIPCFFNEIKYSEYISIDMFRSTNSLHKIIELLYKKNKKKKIMKNATFYKNSFDGYIIGNKRFDKKNIENVTNAFIETFHE